MLHEQILSFIIFRLGVDLVKIKEGSVDESTHEDGNEKEEEEIINEEPEETKEIINTNNLNANLTEEIMPNSTTPLR